MIISYKKLLSWKTLVLVTRKVFKKAVRDNLLPNLDDFDKENEDFKVPKAWEN